MRSGKAASNADAGHDQPGLVAVPGRRNGIDHAVAQLFVMGRVGDAEVETVEQYIERKRKGSEQERGEATAGPSTPLLTGTGLALLPSGRSSRGFSACLKTPESFSLPGAPCGPQQRIIRRIIIICKSDPGITSVNADEGDQARQQHVGQHRRDAHRWSTENTVGVTHG